MASLKAIVISHKQWRPPLLFAEKENLNTELKCHDNKIQKIKVVFLDVLHIITIFWHKVRSLPSYILRTHTFGHVVFVIVVRPGKIKEPHVLEVVARSFATIEYNIGHLCFLSKSMGKGAYSIPSRLFLSCSHGRSRWLLLLSFDSHLSVWMIQAVDLHQSTASMTPSSCSHSQNIWTFYTP